MKSQQVLFIYYRYFCDILCRMKDEALKFGQAIRFRGPIVESCLHQSMTLVSLFWQNGNFRLWRPGSKPWDVLIHFWKRLTSARTYFYDRYCRFKAMSLTAWSLVINIEDTALYLLHWNIIPTLFFFNFSFCHKSLARVALYCKSYIHIKTEDRWNGARKDFFISFKTLAIHVAKTFICNT